jgi:hypothetical protein
MYALSFIILLGAGCRQEPTEQQAAALTAAREMAATPTATSANTPNPALTPVSELNDAQPALGQTPTTTDRTLTLMAGSASASSGSVACLDISAKGFDNLIGMQYSLRWDPAQLQFKEVGKFNLKSLDANDFGARLAAQGALTSAWIEDSLRGVSVPAGTVIYQVCFDVKAPAGTTALVKFHNDPTPYEVIDRNEAILRFEGVDGKVTVK